MTAHDARDDQQASILLAFESDDPSYISSTQFGAMACVLAPFCLLVALVFAVEWGFMFASRADEAWSESIQRPLAEYEVSLDDSSMISVESELCFGYCPEYTLRLYGSGKVEFVGKSYVCDFGHRESTAQPREIRRLVEAMLAAEFTGLPPLSAAPDSYLRRVTLHHDGATHSVNYYFESRPRWLNGMMDELDRVAGTARWLPSVGQDWQLYCKSPEGPMRKLTRDPP